MKKIRVMTGTAILTAWLGLDWALSARRYGDIHRGEINVPPTADHPGHLGSMKTRSDQIPYTQLLVPGSNEQDGIYYRDPREGSWRKLERWNVCGF